MGRRGSGVYVVGGWTAAEAMGHGGQSAATRAAMRAGTRGRHSSASSPVYSVCALKSSTSISGSPLMSSSSSWSEKMLRGGGRRGQTRKSEGSGRQAVGTGSLVSEPTRRGRAGSYSYAGPQPPLCLSLALRSPDELARHHLPETFEEGVDLWRGETKERVRERGTREAFEPTCCVAGETERGRAAGRGAACTVHAAGRTACTAHSVRSASPAAGWRSSCGGGPPG